MAKQRVTTNIIETDNWTLYQRGLRQELHKVIFAGVWLKANADEYTPDYDDMVRMRDALMKILPCLTYGICGLPKIRIVPGARDEKHNPLYYELCVWGRKEIMKPSIILSPKNK